MRQNRHIESDIQINSVKWFRLQWPEIAGLLFSVPNGGSRDREGAITMKREGVIPGVSDVILLYPSGPYSSLCVEFKTQSSKSKQSDAQIAWQQLAERAGNKYVVCRSFKDFYDAIGEYLGPSIIKGTYGRERLKKFE